MTNIKVNSVKICFDEENLRFTLYRDGTAWEWNPSYEPYLEYQGASCIIQI